MKGGSNQKLSLKRVLYQIEILMKVLFPVCYLFLSGTICDWYIFATSILCILRQNIDHLWSSEVISELINSEHVQNLVMTIPYIFFGKKDSIFYSVFALHFLKNVAKFIQNEKGKPYLFTKGMVDQICKNKKRIMMMKNYIEVGILLENCILLPFDFQRIYLIVFHGNYLRIKYYFNNHLTSIFKEMDSYFKENFEKENSNKVFKLIILFVRKLVLRMRVYRE